MAHGVVAPRPAGDERWLGRFRRAAFLGLDVPAAARRRASDDDPRSRSAALPGVDARTNRSNARREVPARGADGERARLQLGVHRRRGARAAARSRRARARRASAAAPVFSPEGERADLGRPYVLTVATLEPRKNLETLLDAHELLGGQTGARRRRRRRVGAAATCSTGRGDPARLRRRRRARAALSRRVASSSIPRASRASAFPVLEAMASGVPVVASAHPSLDEACGDAAVRADPDSAEAIAAAIAERSRAATSSCRSGSRTPRASPARAIGRGAPGGVPRGRCETVTRMRVGIDVSPLRQTRAGTARYLRGLLPHLERLVDVERIAWGGSRPGGHGRARRLVVSARAAAARARARRPALPDLPRAACARRVPLVVTSTTSPCCGTPRRSTAGRARTAASSCRASSARRPRVIARVGVHEARARRAAGRRGGARPRRPERRRASRSSRQGPRADGDYVLAVGTLEPRKNLPRLAEAARRAGVELRVVGAPGWGDVRCRRRRRPLARLRARRRARAPLPRRALRRVPVALRGLRHPRARGARLRRAGRDERGHGDGGGRRRRGRARRPAATRRRSRPGSARGDRAPRRARGAAGPSAHAASRWRASAEATAGVYREAAA